MRDDCFPFDPLVAQTRQGGSGRDNACPLRDVETNAAVNRRGSTGNIRRITRENGTVKATERWKQEQPAIGQNLVR